MTGPVDDLAAELASELVDDPSGEVSASVYETARLVGTAPWLGGHAARVDYLCAAQHADGSWGPPDGYAIVPTLSATEALLACQRQTGPYGGRRATRDQLDRLARVAARGLAALRQRLRPGAAHPPDTIAVEVVVPALVAAINRHLDVARSDPSWRAARWLSGPSLGLPPGFRAEAPALLRGRLATGSMTGTGPQTWWASLESLMPPNLPGGGPVRPVDGAVACSPAATAAWLSGGGVTPAADWAREDWGSVGWGADDWGSGGSDRVAAMVYLDRLQARGGGPVPGVSPITAFERAWVLCHLADAAPRYTVPAQLLDDLEATLGPTGAPAAPGLPPDCDDTAAVLTALLRHGRDRGPQCLLGYLADRHFACFPGERTASTSTNAHALEAFEWYLLTRPAHRARFARPADVACRWLLDTQAADGSWSDKWHASPYYATVCCVQALRLRSDPASRRAVGRAVEWVLDTQRRDGSWGRWTGTVEETSYAVQTLVLGMGAAARDVGRFLVRGEAFLRARPVTAGHPGLWHAKDLYAPIRVIRAARLAALTAAAAVTLTVEAVAARPVAVGAALRLPSQRSARARSARSGTGAASRPR